MSIIDPYVYPGCAARPCRASTSGNTAVRNRDCEQSRLSVAMRHVATLAVESHAR